MHVNWRVIAWDETKTRDWLDQSVSDAGLENAKQESMDSQKSR